MTFAEKLSHVAKDDPKFAKSVKRMRVASWVFGIGVAAALGFALWSLAIGFSNQTQITRIESPCLRYGAKSEQCKEAFEQAVLTISHAQACAILRKAGLEIQPCVHARLAQESTRRRQRASNREPVRTAHPRASTSQPGPTSHHGANSGAGKGGGSNGNGGSGGPSKPPASAGHPPSSPSGSGPSTAPTPSPQVVPPHPAAEAGKALEGKTGDVGGVVKGAGEGVNNAAGKAVEGVGQVAEGAVCGTLEAVGCSK